VVKLQKKQLLNCNGNRTITLQRRKMEEQRRVPVVVQKKEHPKIEVNPAMIDRIVSNIQMRSTQSRSSFAMQFLSSPLSSARINNLDTLELKSPSALNSSQFSVAHRRPFAKFSKRVEKSERSLQTHEHYKQVWNRQMQLSIRARESLEGKVNESQALSDLTISEKMDGEYTTDNAIKRVLSASFEAK